jgi:predicted methyltransferase
MDTKYDNAVKISRILMERHIKGGMTAVDMTMGNGRDTLFLLGCVGKDGFVYAFDIQRQAVQKTMESLRNSTFDNYKLINDSHENCSGYIESGTVDVIVFNLGYLPGGNKNIFTKKETTIKALKSSLELLKPLGTIFLTAYTAHDSGEEYKHVLEIVKALPQKEYNMAVVRFENQINQPPVLIVIEKRNV